MQQTLSHFFLSLLAIAVACGAVNAAEQRYPSKPIRFIIPTAPGGGSEAARTGKLHATIVATPATTSNAFIG